MLLIERYSGNAMASVESNHVVKIHERGSGTVFVPAATGRGKGTTELNRGWVGDFGVAPAMAG